MGKSGEAPSHGAAFGAPEVTADPYPFYVRARRDCPVYHVPGTQDYLVTLWADVQTVAAACPVITHRGRPPSQGTDALRYADEPGLEDNDAPPHTDVRRAVMGLFSPAAIRRYAPVIEQEVERLLDAVGDEDEIEFIARYAIHIPPMAVGHALGLPREVFPRLKPFADSFAQMKGLLGKPPPPALLAAYTEFTNFCGDVVSEKRAHPDDGPISAMANARDSQGELLSVPSLMSTLRNLISGGAESTILLMANALVDVLQGGLQDEAIADDRRWYAIVEESLRKDAPAQYTGARRVIEDFELHGVTIPKGARILAGWGPAGRDPEVFDDPDVFRLGRPNPREHMGFGYGAHFCVGAPLARAEAVIAFRSLFRRYPRLKLSAGRPLERMDAYPNLRGFKQVWVELGPRT